MMCQKCDTTCRQSERICHRCGWKLDRVYYAKNSKKHRKLNRQLAEEKLFQKKIMTPDNVKFSLAQDSNDFVNLLHTKGIIKGSRVYYDHSISGGGGCGSGGYVNIKPIEHEKVKHNEFWITDDSGIDHFFDFEFTVTNGQTISVFTCEIADSVFPIAAHNHSSGHYKEFLPRFKESSASSSKIGYFFAFLFLLSSAYFFKYAYSKSGFFEILGYIWSIALGIAGVVTGVCSGPNVEDKNMSKLFVFVDSCMASENINN